LPAEAGVRQNLASTYQRAGDILTGAGRTPRSVGKAVDHYRKSLALFQVMEAGNPDDRRLRQIGLQVQVALAGALALAGEHPEAERTIGGALARAAGLRAQDPKDANVAVDHLSALVQGAAIANRRGDRDGAIRHAREALDSAARLTEETRKSRDMRNAVGEAKAQLGIALVASAERAVVDRSRRLALLEDARALLADAHSFIAEIRAEKLGIYDESEAREIVDALERCDAALARLKADRPA
jgi:tetratricopeptide (TPR) repeat protein